MSGNISLIELRSSVRLKNVEANGNDVSVIRTFDDKLVVFVGNLFLVDGYFTFYFENQASECLDFVGKVVEIFF